MADIHIQKYTVILSHKAVVWLMKIFRILWLHYHEMYYLPLEKSISSTSLCCNPALIIVRSLQFHIPT